jgi:hypothetical protein
MRRSGVRPPSAPPRQNPDRVGIFWRSEGSLPDEFWANSSSNSSSSTRLTGTQVRRLGQGQRLNVAVSPIVGPCVRERGTGRQGCRKRGLGGRSGRFCALRQRKLRLGRNGHEAVRLASLPAAGAFPIRSIDRFRDRTVTLRFLVSLDCRGTRSDSSVHAYVAYYRRVHRPGDDRTPRSARAAWVVTRDLVSVVEWRKEVDVGDRTKWSFGWSNRSERKSFCSTHYRSAQLAQLGVRTVVRLRARVTATRRARRACSMSRALGLSRSRRPAREPSKTMTSSNSLPFDL